MLFPKLIQRGLSDVPIRVKVALFTVSIITGQILLIAFAPPIIPAALFIVTIAALIILATRFEHN
jgi:hypothetical protein